MTSYEIVYERFFNRIVEDKDFFMYANISVEEVLNIAKKRANTYLISSISYLLLKCSPDVDFRDRDDQLETFKFDLTDEEIKIFVELMFREFMALEQVNLKVNETWFSDRDMKVMGSSHLERTTFRTFLDGITNECNKLIKGYIARDRVTGKRKMISFQGL